MKNNKPSIDGFIPRRAGSQLGELHTRKHPEDDVESIDRSLHTGDNTEGNLVGVARGDKLIGESELEQSLRDIDDEEPKSKRRRRKDRKQEGRVERPRRKVLRIVKWTVIGLLILGALVAGYLILKVVLAGKSVFQGSIFDIVQTQPLKEDANGRSNFLVFGTEAEGHPGADLTDSIMVVSIDQEKKDAFMLSLPRDFWVRYQETCMVGNEGKLNATYFCASNDSKNEPAGAAALMRKAGEITGLSIQYYVHLNWAALIQGVNAVGGIDLTIESEDPRGILDRNFDWICNYTCYYVNYKNGQKVHLDGEHALALARARNASGGYGLPGGNFDREKNQQRIIIALRDKAVSAGTLTNLGKVTGLIDALGKNLRTNIETKEIQTLMNLGRDITPDKIVSLTLVDKDKPLVTTGLYNGQSIVRPIPGLYDFSAIHAYVKKKLSSDPMVREEPHITVLNGSGVAGVAQTRANELTKLGAIIDKVGNAPKGTYEPIEVYQISDKKPGSAAKLQELYGVTIKTTKPPASVVGATDFLIIIGPAQQ